MIHIFMMKIIYVVWQAWEFIISSRFQPLEDDETIESSDLDEEEPVFTLIKEQHVDFTRSLD